MKNDLLRGSVHSCLRECVREMHPSIIPRIIVDGTDALLGAKGFITFAVLFKEMIELENRESPIYSEIGCIRVSSEVKYEIFSLEFINVNQKYSSELTDEKKESLRIISNAAASLGGDVAWNISEEGFKWVLNFSLQKMSV